MKDNSVYLIYNTVTNNFKFKSLKEPVEKQSSYWEYLNDEEFISLYDPKYTRETIDIKIHSKTKHRERPKSAGDVVTKVGKATVEEVSVRRSFSLSNIDDFFLERRIPLIKPLLSEREILKLQILQETCRKKRSGVEADKRGSLKSSIDDKDLRFYPELEEETTKDKGKDISSLYLDSKFKRTEDNSRRGEKTLKDTEEYKKTKTPLSENSKQKAKKLIKDINSNTVTNTPEIRKKEKKKANNKARDKTKLDRPQKVKTDTTKTKSKMSKESVIQHKKDDIKTKDQTKIRKSRRELGTKSEEKKPEEKVKHKRSYVSDTNESGKKPSKQKLKNEISENNISSKVVGKHSKNETSQGKKSDKSESSNSKKISKPSKERKEQDKDVKEQNVKSQFGKFDPDVEDSRKSKEDIKHDDGFKGDEKIKPISTSEKISDGPSKEKPFKINAEGKLKNPSLRKSVKFPFGIQHIIHYVLSNSVFVKLGWTLGPSDQAQLRVVTFKAIPATPNTYCFRERTEDEIKYYSKSLEKVAYHFRQDGTGEIFYPSGATAAVTTNNETGMRLTLYSDPLNDPLIKDSYNSKVLAIFDSSGNGVVYDMQGSKLLNFNQLEGIFRSPLRQSPYKWQWCDYKTLDKQRIKALLRYMAKEQMKSVPAKKVAPPTSGSSKKIKPEEVDEVYEKILGELPYPVPQKTKTKSENQSWGFKPITLKINSTMTLRINGQDDVSISFSTNKIFIRLDLGVKIDPDMVERIEELSPKSVSEVPCVFDAILDPSPSM